MDQMMATHLRCSPLEPSILDVEHRPEGVVNGFLVERVISSAYTTMSLSGVAQRYLIGGCLMFDGTRAVAMSGVVTASMEDIDRSMHRSMS
jgi:hypothetical protein